ncbi:putative peptidase C1A, papain, patatin-like phospholipase domain-containing protein [Helianthus anomalus]
MIDQRRKGKTESFKSDRYSPTPADVLPESADWRERGDVALVKDQGTCDVILKGAVRKIRKKKLGGGGWEKQTCFIPNTKRDQGLFFHDPIVENAQEPLIQSINPVTVSRIYLSVGSSWAFSTIGSVDAVHHITTGELITLSEQQLLDCDTSYNKGCNGGDKDHAFAFIVESGGIHAADDYPYTGKDEGCYALASKAFWIDGDEELPANHKTRKAVCIDGYEGLPANDEQSLLKAVANQPVSVSIEADWGEQGYVRIERNVIEKTGKCGIAMEALYHVKNGQNPDPVTPEHQKLSDEDSYVFGNRITILSIDWGGVRALLPTSALVFLEARIQNFRLADVFDVITGTSTGGLVTAMLTTPDKDGLPMFTAKEVQNFYLKHAPEIFPPGRYQLSTLSSRQSDQSFMGPKYDGVHLHKVIREQLEERRLHETITNVVIPTFDIKAMKPVIFSSFQDVTLSDDMASMDLATDENLENLVEAGEKLLKKPVTRMNFVTGEVEHDPHITNEMVIESFATTLRDIYLAKS